MKHILYLSTLIFIGCSSIYKPDVWDDMKDSKVHTLRLYTGSNGESLYESNFKEKAKEICHGSYEIIDKTRKPKTLHQKLYSNEYYTWIIRCL